ncbi:MAG: hypothetical protein WD250_15145 [Egibacteraceae bacterium]
MTPTTVWTKTLDRHLADLLTGGEAGLESGAELEVRHPAGEVAFRAPLARHHRVEGTSLVWVRPIDDGYVPDRSEAGQPPYAFDVDVTRRRALEFTTARIDGATIRFVLTTGQHAVVRPAGPDTLAELQRWDTYYYTVLDAETQRELDALDHDP